MELTKEYFDKSIKNLITKKDADKFVSKEHFDSTLKEFATKKDLEGLVTKDHFEKMVGKLATQESLDELAERVTSVEKTLNGHTTALANLSTEMKKVTDSRIVDMKRVSQAEGHIRELAKHANLKLEY